MTTIRNTLLAGAALAALAAAVPPQAAAQVVNVYSARHYDSDEPLWQAFQKSTGVRVAEVQADYEKLFQRVKAEGANSPGDVLITVDAGRLEHAVANDLCRPVRSEVLEKAIPASLRHPEGKWFGLTMRARVLVYDKTRTQPSQLSTYEDLADPKWKGKIVVRSSTNVYNQSLTGSVLAALGPEKTLAWAKGIAANLARPPKGGDRDQILAVAAGEGEVAISNTYYFAHLLKAQPDKMKNMAVFFPNQGDRGTHVNVSGACVMKNAPNAANAVRFLEFLVTPEAQKVFAEANFEYPVVAGVPMASVIADFGTFKPDQLNAATFGKNNAEALKIMDLAGWK
ncbi:MAG: Fe(3+) ABC transporter substrate-binding protein [Thalassobaculales bacterium]